MHRIDGKHGDLALVLRGDTRIAYLHLWPHVRPWRLQRTQPMLRCLPDVDGIAAKVAAAWSVANGQAAAATPEALAQGHALPGLAPQMPNVSRLPHAARAVAGH